MDNNPIHKALQTIDLEPGATWEEVVARHKLLARFWHSDKARGDDKPVADRELAKFNHARDILKAHFQGGEHRDGPDCLCQPAATATGSASAPGGSDSASGGGGGGDAHRRQAGAAGAAASSSSSSSYSSSSSSSSSSSASQASSNSASSASASASSSSSASSASQAASDSQNAKQTGPVRASRAGKDSSSAGFSLSLRQKIVLGVLAFSLFGFMVGGVRKAVSGGGNEAPSTAPQKPVPVDSTTDPSHLIQIPSQDSPAPSTPSPEPEVLNSLPESTKPDPQLLIEQGRAWSDVDRYQKAVRQNNSNITQLKLKLAQSALTPAMRSMLEQELARREEELSRDKVSLGEAESRLKQLGGFQGRTVHPEPGE
ncbi:MAG TPA: hypothetical protein PL112_10755 [Candidatus Obscuribacter sp.]|nr:hypothetical protein [Candidatus Obscuribacter sp.]HND67270.1 hypothetical protein [Candidatus Obscuribacter sp.]